ncbi:hypothetical protein FDI90_gp249 [Pseudomonas phage PA7]|uniref:Uncharacterized protein n=1 Tax=Pseudomonas phage PA7 TaxID=347330 RepID=I7DAZ5_9CAUD|nr:hypothetical protein FDI90_gp249 [Pseudomonas phage PA7]AFO71056.1 hypothetical protein [Pseudomonas phage PA7]
MNYAQYNLPVDFESVDTSTFDPNLPNGNYLFSLPLQLSPHQQHPQLQPYFNGVIGLFRLNAQNAATTTQLHAFAYNLLSSNGFQNNYYHQWAQKVIDFLEFLFIHRQMVNNPQQAMQQAASLVWSGFVGKCAQTFPQLQSLVQHLMPNIQQALGVIGQIESDIQKMRMGGNTMMQGGYQQPGVQPGSFPGMGAAMGRPGMSSQLPPINAGIQQTYGQPATMANPQLNIPGAYTPTTNHDTGPSIANAAYDVPGSSPFLENKPVMQPKDSWGATVEVSPNSSYDTIPGGGDVMILPELQQNANTVTNDNTDLPIPQDVKELVFDPNYYVPNGFVINKDRPMDVIYNPGGIEIRPAHLVADKPDWVRTASSANPYSILMDPAVYCRFLAKWPDNTVHEVYRKWENHMEMDYLKHELQDDLRRQAHRGGGARTATSYKLSTIMGDAKPVKEVAEEFSPNDAGLTDNREHDPVILEGYIACANNLEAEAGALNAVREALELSEDDVVPAHEYRAASSHPFDASTEVMYEIEDIRKEPDPHLIAKRLKQLMLDGKLAQRYYRFLVERLTSAVNEFLADSMSQKVTIDDFCEDIGDLIAYLIGKKGKSVADKFTASIPFIVGRSMCVNIDPEEGNSILDLSVRFQTGWRLEELSCLNIYTEKAVLISKLTEPKITQVIMGMAKRLNSSKDSDDARTHKMYIITADGSYLQVIRGALVDNAVLLKLIK